MNLSVEDLITELAIALEVPAASLTENTHASDLEQWDSLGQISILVHLDRKFNNITENCPDLASANSVKEIFMILNEQSG
jgi:hypothetical protein